MAKHFYKNTKFFVNVIWKNHIVNSQFIMSEDNFYYCDCDLGSIWLEEYEMDVMYNVPFGKNTLMKNGKVEAIIEDNRYNHMSQRTHDTLSNLIYDFFVNQKMPKNTNNMFEKRFHKTTDQHLRVIQEKEFEEDKRKGALLDKQELDQLDEDGLTEEDKWILYKEKYFGKEVTK